VVPPGVHVARLRGGDAVSREKPFRAVVKPIWRDMDALRHVNNAVYLTYLENAREAYWRAFAGDLQLFPFTLARVEIDYRAEATWNDLLTIAMWVSRVGNSSFEISYEISAQDGRRVAEAKTVTVMLSDDRKAPRRIPEELRKKLEAFEADPPAAP
jgi:acyl-CoA thioester hydrolase